MNKVLAALSLLGTVLATAVIDITAAVGSPMHAVLPMYGTVLTVEFSSAVGVSALEAADVSGYDIGT